MDNPSSVPFYLNPRVWTAIVAVLALILSQLPPVRLLFRGRKVAINAPEIIIITYVFGNINFSFLLSLHNVGGRKVTISKLNVAVRDPEGTRWNLPQQTYSRSTSPDPSTIKQDFLLGWIPLRPDEYWSENIKCFRILV